jgi:hypothetical protein
MPGVSAGEIPARRGAPYTVDGARTPTSGRGRGRLRAVKGSCRLLHLGGRPGFFPRAAGPPARATRQRPGRAARQPAGQARGLQYEHVFLVADTHTEASLRHRTNPRTDTSPCPDRAGGLLTRPWPGHRSSRAAAEELHQRLGGQAVGLAEAVKFRSFNRVGKRALCLGSDLRQPSSAKHFHKMLAGLTHGCLLLVLARARRTQACRISGNRPRGEPLPAFRFRAPHWRHGHEQVYPDGGFGHHLKPFRAAVEAGTAGAGRALRGAGRGLRAG